MKKYKRNISSKELNKKENGITLIALVITIIVLLILAGITIATLAGDNGILSKANTAGEESKKKEYEEVLKIIGNGLRADKIINSWDNKTYLDEFEKEIKKEEIFKESSVIRKDVETINVLTKETFIFIIKENEIKCNGIYNGVKPPDLQESNVTFTPSTEDWTKENIEVEIATTVENYTLEYSLDGINWEKYINPITMTDNGAIYARLIDSFGMTGGVATKNITNIDRIPPTISCNLGEEVYARILFRF